VTDKPPSHCNYLLVTSPNIQKDLKANAGVVPLINSLNEKKKGDKNNSKFNTRIIMILNPYSNRGKRFGTHISSLFLPRESLRPEQRDLSLVDWCVY
jgi:hypothetical protein